TGAVLVLTTGRLALGLLLTTQVAEFVGDALLLGQGLAAGDVRLAVIVDDRLDLLLPVVQTLLLGSEVLALALTQHLEDPGLTGLHLQQIGRASCRDRLRRWATA